MSSEQNQYKADLTWLNRAVEVALESERNGNLPVGAVVVYEGEVVAEGFNAVKTPVYHPGRHAEVEALRGVPEHLWKEARKLTCYTTLEPCLMCCGSLILHGVGRIVFGAIDPKGGAGYLLDHLPEYYEGRSNIPELTGPLMPETCDPLYQRAAEMFENLGGGLEV